MNGLNNGKRMFGVGALCVLLMSAAGCTELLDEATNALNDLEAEYYDLYTGDTSEVTLEIYHGESLIDATANYTVVIELDHVNAPFHADNFRNHSLEGNYNDVTFHRIIDDFMIQGGDFQNNDGTGGYAAKWYGVCNGQFMNGSDCSNSESYNVPDEADNGLDHLSCTISMAKTSYPNTGGSQFFIIPEDSTPDWLNGAHTVFGTVTSGCEHITTISEVETGQGDRPVLPVVIHTATASE
ncbi:MAG: peptidylprolyl isomerase [Candidatus Poseidoniaceae archaeon]|nr:peptidylprolyl isomerase [Candidatus Poseidoniaceae archaeon]